MAILVSGSLAFDRIMNFNGKFSDHIIPEKLNDINVSFTVDNLTENFGGTAGNIAFALHCLGETPMVLATLGYDHYRYTERLNELGINSDFVKIIADDATSSGFVTTDSDSNQITAFNLGAMKYQCGFNEKSIELPGSIAIIAPGNIEDMKQLSQIYQESSVYSIFDPSQSLPIWNKTDLANSINQADVTISNEYELSLILNILEINQRDLINLTGTLITTLGEKGSEFFTGTDHKIIPPIKIEKEIDPTGAGDAYRGGLIKGLIEGWELEKCCALGSAVASVVVASRGTQNYFVNFDEIIQNL